MSMRSVLCVALCCFSGVVMAQWKKSVVNDELTGKSSYVSHTIESTKPFHLDSPYEGENKAVFEFRMGKIPGGSMATLSIERGQFSCGVSSRCILRVVVDGGEPFTMEGTYPESLKRSALIVENVPQEFWLAPLHKKSIKIEAPFYETGRVVLVFDHK